MLLSCPKILAQIADDNTFYIGDPEAVRLRASLKFAFISAIAKRCESPLQVLDTKYITKLKQLGRGMSGNRVGMNCSSCIFEGPFLGRETKNTTCSRVGQLHNI